MSSTASIALVREALAEALEALTPDYAPGLAFEQHDDFCRIEDLTDPGRMRKFKVVAFTPRPSSPWSSTTATYEYGLAVRVGYSLEEAEEIDGESYEVEAIRDHDFAQLDPFIITGDWREGLGVLLVRHGEPVDVAGGRVRELRYGIQLDQGYTNG